MLAGAGIDVFEEEPLSRDSPLRNLGDKVLLSPHMVSSNLGSGLHVYRHDRSTHTTEHVDVTPTGQLSTGSSFAQRLNGNYFLTTNGPNPTVVDDQEPPL